MTFLFDIGKVLLDFHFESSLATLLPPDSPDSADRLAQLMERKDDFESGKIRGEDYIPWAIERLGADIPHERFTAAWRDIFTPVEPMWRSVEKLAAGGHRLILFSNTNDIHCPWIFETFAIFRHFPEAVLSFQAGAIKPDDAIYHHAIRRHQLVPEETLYIDDLAPNIATGERLGFRCWRYDLNDHPSFEAWLAGQLG